MGENFVQYGLHLREGPVLLPLEAPIHRELTLTKQHVLDKKKRKKKKRGRERKRSQHKQEKKVEFWPRFIRELGKKEETLLRISIAKHIHFSSLYLIPQQEFERFLFYLDKISLLGHSSNHYGCTSCARKAILPLAFNTYIVHKFT